MAGGSYGVANYDEGHFGVAKYVDGAASASPSSAVSANGNRVQFVSAAAAPAASSTATCNRVQFSAAALTPTGATGSVGYEILQDGAASLASAAAVSVSANFTAASAAALSSAASITSYGLRVPLGAVVVGPRASTSALGQRIQQPAASLSAELAIAQVDSALATGGAAETSILSTSDAAAVRVRESNGSTAAEAAFSINYARVRLADALVDGYDASAASAACERVRPTSAALIGTSASAADSQRIGESSAAIDSEIELTADGIRYRTAYVDPIAESNTVLSYCERVRESDAVIPGDTTSAANCERIQRALDTEILADSVTNMSGFITAHGEVDPIQEDSDTLVNGFITAQGVPFGIVEDSDIVSSGREKWEVIPPPQTTWSQISVPYR